MSTETEIDMKKAEQSLKTSYGILYVIAGMGEAGVQGIADVGFGITHIIVGAIFIGLGFMVYKQFSKPAIYVAMVLISIQILSSFLVMFDGGYPPVGGVVAIKGILLVSLFKSLKVIDVLKASKSTT